jgi:hypothetical protein
VTASAGILCAAADRCAGERMDERGARRRG